MGRVVMTMRPGSRGTKKLVEVFGNRLVAVRYRTDGSASRIATAEIIVDPKFIALHQAALAAPPDAPRDRPEVLTPDADTFDDTERGATPCVCAALPPSVATRRLTFVFAETDTALVLATVDEPPLLWAVGTSIAEARMNLAIEVGLVLAANPPRDRAKFNITNFLQREVVVLPPRRADDARPTNDRSCGA